MPAAGFAAEERRGDGPVRPRPVAERVARADWPALEPAWRRLAAGAIEPNVFAGPDFLGPHAAFAAPACELLVVRAPDDPARLLALAPITLSRRGSGVLGRVQTLWTSDYAPLGTPLIAADDPVGAWTALLAAAAERDGVLVIEDMRLAGPAHAAFSAAIEAAGHGYAPVFEHRRAALEAGLSPEAWLAASIDKKQRKEQARQWRRLAEQGSLDAEPATEPAEIEAAFAAFVELEDRGWKGRAGTSLARRPDALAFATAAVAALARSQRVSIERIRLDGRLVAAVVCLVDDGAVWPWKTAYDEDLSSLSPGVQVMLRATERMLALPGFRGADSLAVAGHPMIDHLWRDRIRIGTLVVDLGATARARLVAADIRAWQSLHVAARAARDRLRREMRRFALPWSV